MVWKTFDWPVLANRKCATLERKDMRPVGIVMADKDGKRATVDRFGRVQWWKLDGSGKMVDEAMRHRIECLRGALKSASGWLFDLDDIKGADACLEMAGDMEPPIEASSASPARLKRFTHEDLREWGASLDREMPRGLGELLLRYADDWREENERLRSYFELDANCPCCQQTYECEDGCSFAEDAPDDYEKMVHAREILTPNEEAK